MMRKMMMLAPTASEIVQEMKDQGLNWCYHCGQKTFVRLSATSQQSAGKILRCFAAKRRLHCNGRNFWRRSISLRILAPDVALRKGDF